MNNVRAIVKKSRNWHKHGRWDHALAFSVEQNRNRPKRRSVEMFASMAELMRSRRRR